MRILLNEEPVPTETFKECCVISLAKDKYEDPESEKNKQLLRYHIELSRFISKINTQFFELFKPLQFAKGNKYVVSVIITRPKDWKDNSKYARCSIGPLNYARTVVRALFESGYDLPELGWDGESLHSVTCTIQEGDSWSILIDVARVG